MIWSFLVCNIRHKGQGTTLDYYHEKIVCPFSLGVVRSCTYITLSGNNKNRIFSVHFHPVAKNILITTSRDVNVKFFDLEHKKEALSIEGTHTDIVQSISWNWNGSTLVTSCKDKIMRFWDPRNKKMTSVRLF